MTTNDTRWIIVTISGGVLQGADSSFDLAEAGIELHLIDIDDIEAGGDERTHEYSAAPRTESIEEVTKEIIESYR